MLRGFSNNISLLCCMRVMQLSKKYPRIFQNSEFCEKSTAPTYLIKEVCGFLNSFNVRQPSTILM